MLMPHPKRVHKKGNTKPATHDEIHDSRWTDDTKNGIHGTVVFEDEAFHGIALAVGTIWFTAKDTCVVNLTVPQAGKFGCS